MWYEINETEKVISPSLLFYKERIKENIERMVAIAGSADRLVPHVKTHKTSEIVKLQLEAGITKFKCATVAEAEMVAEAGGDWILIAYQLVGPNIERLARLKLTYPNVVFSSLVDNEMSASELLNGLRKKGLSTHVFIDINTGMHRTGHPMDADLTKLHHWLLKHEEIQLFGLHIYDGHIRDEAFEQRKAEADSAIDRVITTLAIDLPESNLMLIAGGSPTFNVHAMNVELFLSPGTNVLWDLGYGSRFRDQDFLHAALILTRVISKPLPGVVTIDLGHKAIAAENPIDRRFDILNLENYTVKSQSEEHGVLTMNLSDWDQIEIGKVLYALPYHVCPTVALHDFATVIESQAVLAEWEIIGRNRRISI